LEEAVGIVRDVCPESLALYVFSEWQANINFLLGNTESGGVAINSAMEHLGNNKLPFGGKGTSGMG